MLFDPKQTFLLLLQTNQLLFMMDRNRLKVCLIVLLSYSFTNGWSQFQLTGAMINSCGSEGNQEFVTFRTNQVVDPDLVSISYGSDGNCNTFVVFNGMRQTPVGAVESINTLAGCDAFLIAPDMIPADSEVFVFDVDFNPGDYEDWEVFCGRTIYIVFTQYPNPNGNFVNSANTRFFCTSYDGQDLGTYDYTNTTRSVDGTSATWTDGPGSVESDIPSMANCSFGTIACNPPVFQNPGNQVACDTFVLPQINGMALSGNEAYYTQNQGGGTPLQPGQFILNSQTLFIFDASSECSPEVSFQVEIIDEDTAPQFDNPGDQVVCDTFVLPPITGQNLTGNEAYFTGPNGSGIEIEVGTPYFEVTDERIYLFDPSTPCNNEVSFSITTIESQAPQPPSDSLKICYSRNPFAFESNQSVLKEAIGAGEADVVFWYVDQEATQPVDFNTPSSIENLISNNQGGIFARIESGDCISAMIEVPLILQNVTIEFPNDTTLLFCPSDLPETFVIDQPEADVLWTVNNTNQMISDTAFMFNLEDLPIGLDLEVTQPNCPEQSFMVDLELSGDCPCEVVMPNAFTPNNDGDNDFYFPAFSPDCIPLVQDFKLMIYNRWGQLVYESMDTQDMGWNGEYDGNRAASDVYVYILEYRPPEKDGVMNEIKKEKGDLTLVR